jgi:hypothetical protein
MACIENVTKIYMASGLGNHDVGINMKCKFIEMYNNGSTTFTMSYGNLSLMLYKGPKYLIV